MDEQHFNNLTPAEAERLAMLAEECAEVIRVIGKIQRHGYRSYNPNDHTLTKNWLLLMYKLNDIGAIVHGMIEAGDYSESNFSIQEQAKIWQRKLMWTHHQGEK